MIFSAQPVRYVRYDKTHNKSNKDQTEQIPEQVQHPHKNSPDKIYSVDPDKFRNIKRHLFSLYVTMKGNEERCFSRQKQFAGKKLFSSIIKTQTEKNNKTKNNLLSKKYPAAFFISRLALHNTLQKSIGSTLCKNYFPTLPFYPSSFLLYKNKHFTIK